MDLQSAHKVLTTNETDTSRAHQVVAVLQEAPQHVICVGLGLVGGATGVALVIGIAILVQVLLPPPTVFSPGTIPLTVAAALAGLGVSWLLVQGGRCILPRLFHRAGEQGLQVILIFSTFTSLLQSVLFTRGF